MHVYVEMDDIEDISITWSEDYKQITLYLKNGESYTVEQDY